MPLGKVSVYVQRHISLKLRKDLMSDVVVVLWLQVHLPHLKPLLSWCRYRPSANSQRLNNMYTMLDSVCDVNREVCFLGDLNIDWLATSCPLKTKLLWLMAVIWPKLSLNQLECKPVVLDRWHPIVLIVHSLILQSFGRSDHDIVEMTRKTKVPKVEPKAIYKRP